MCKIKNIQIIACIVKIDLILFRHRYRTLGDRQNRRTARKPKKLDFRRTVIPSGHGYPVALPDVVIFQRNWKTMMIGKDVIVRTYSSGVHFGTLVSREGKEVVLSNARRIWYWEGAFTLSAVAGKGVSQKSMLSVPVSEILLTEAIEIIPCTADAIKNLREMKAHE
jgi:hypothetical protein